MRLSGRGDEALVPALGAGAFCFPEGCQGYALSLTWNFGRYHRTQELCFRGKDQHDDH